MNSEIHSKALYDSIGISYDNSRKADPHLSKRMFHYISSGKEGLYLDVGCGTGNYTCALSVMGLNFIGFDPSEEMLRKARAKNSSITWKHGIAENIDLPSDSVDGVLVSLSIHHWNDLGLGFKEIARVMKKNRKIVLFTSLPEQTKSYWLKHYFPEIIEKSGNALPGYDQIEKSFNDAILKIVNTELYIVKPDLEDLFLYSGKFNPELYFNADVRSSISSFSSALHQQEVKKGLQHLKKDIESGKIKEIMNDYENEMGDYLFIIGEKVS